MGKIAKNKKIWKKNKISLKKRLKNYGTFKKRPKYWEKNRKKIWKMDKKNQIKKFGKSFKKNPN